MKIKAKVSFCGVLSMGAGEIRECTDKEILTDLLRAGYVEEVKDEPVEEPKKPAAPRKKKQG